MSNMELNTCPQAKQKPCLEALCATYRDFVSCSVDMLGSLWPFLKAVLTYSKIGPEVEAKLNV